MHTHTRLPVNKPPKVVFTPDELLTAVRVKEPVTGIDRTSEPPMLHNPNASISCVPSKDLPFAKSS